MEIGSKYHRVMQFNIIGWGRRTKFAGKTHLPLVHTCFPPLPQPYFAKKIRPHLGAVPPIMILANREIPISASAKSSARKPYFVRSLSPAATCNPSSSRVHILRISSVSKAKGNHLGRTKEVRHRQPCCSHISP